MRRLLTSFAALALLNACGPGEVGEACQGTALEEVCVEGAICTPGRSEQPEPLDDPNSEPYACRTICEVEADCEGGMECRRVAGSMLSSCQPSDDPSDEPSDGDDEADPESME